MAREENSWYIPGGRSVLDIEALVNPDFTGAVRREALAGVNKKVLKAEKAAELADFKAAAKARAEAAKTGAVR